MGEQAVSVELIVNGQPVYCPACGAIEGQEVFFWAFSYLQGIDKRIIATKGTYRCTRCNNVFDVLLD